MKKNLLAFIMVLSAIFANAQTETEPNGSFAEADTLTFGNCISQTIDPAGDQDYFIIQLPKGGILEINLNNLPTNFAAQIDLYNAGQSLVYNGSFPTNTLNVGWQFVACPGTYYFRITDYWGAQITTPTMLCVNLDTADSGECNQNIAAAYPIPVDTCLTEKIYGWDIILNHTDVDFYKITIPQAGTLEINLNALPGPIAAQINLYDSSQILLYNGSFPINTYNAAWQFLVHPGVYYIKFDDYWGAQDSGAFTFCTHLDLTDSCEFNQNFATACPIPADTCLTEKIYGWDPTLNHTDVDYYQVTATQAGVLEINLNALPAAIAPQINFYNSSHVLLYNGSYPVSTPDVGWQFVIIPGVYYIKIDDYYGAQDSGAFTFCTHLDVSDNCEFNESFATACTIPIDTCLTEKIYGWDVTLNHTDVDYYKVIVPQAGTLEINLNALPGPIAAQINFYNSSQVPLYNGSFPINTFNVGWQFLVPPATYYIKIDDYWGAQDSGAFTFCTHLDLTDSCESNGDFSNACPKPEVTCFAEKIYGWDVSINQTEKDYYKVHASLTGTFYINVSNIPAAIALQLCVKDSANTTACIINPNNPVNTPNANWSFNTIANHTYYLIFDDYFGVSDSGSFNTCFDINVGLQDLSSDSQFSMTPNPASTQLQIELKGQPEKNCLGEITNVVGETIMEIKSVNTQSITVDISKLAPGIYFVQLQTENGNSTRKLIKH